MSLSSAEFLLGVLVAVASFLVKELISYSVRGIQFRRRLATDIQMIVAAHKEHYPDLEILMRDLLEPEALASFIWDSEGDSLKDVQDHSHFLRSDEAHQATAFYDELSRIDEIRREYNTAVRYLIVEVEKYEGYTAIAKGCLSDLERHYKQVARRGSECLLLLNSNHWFLKINTAQCRETLDRLAE